MTMPTAGVPAPVHRSFVERVIGALRLDAATYDEVEHDESSLGQAAGVVAIAAIATAIGAAGQRGSPVGVLLGAVLGWLISTGFIWVVGVYWMQHTSDYRELLRTLGFASAPNLLAFVGAIPGIGGLLALGVGLWGLAAWVVAARQALDVTTGRAVLVCVLAVLVNAAVVVGLALTLGVLLGGGRTPGTIGS